MNTGINASFLLRLIRRRMRIWLAPALRLFRTSAFWQIVICALTGVVVGAAVALLREGVLLLHRLFFALPSDGYLSEGTDTSHLRILLVPVLGGLALALFRHVIQGRAHKETVDPIEANALYGGRMSFRDTLRITINTVISNCAGASLGMEAGYSQLGAWFYSHIGQRLKLRRGDLRLFTAAGAGAAIAAAFNAPLAGAFYGFELILGEYSTRTLVPVVAAAVCAALTQGEVSHMHALFSVSGGVIADTRDYALFGAVGVLAAGVAVLSMRAVTGMEKALRATGIPSWLRPAVGGLMLSAIALIFPQVLGSGHGAIQYHLDQAWPWFLVLALLVAKILASAISIGSGFRGGLFSSSLLLGALLGGVVAQFTAVYLPWLAVSQPSIMLAGMGAVAAGIIGAPFTMVFLTLEMTGDFPVTVGVLVAVMISSMLVRLCFGYTFATWRFQLKGIGIRGAHDVGWISDLTAVRLMRADARIVPQDMSVRAIRAAFPPGTTKHLFILDPQGCYVGQMDAVSAHAPEYDKNPDERTAGQLARYGDAFLLPGQNVREALLCFEENQLESLPVITSATERRVLGYMTEGYARKRYTQQLEQLRAQQTGEDLFPIGKPGKSA